MKLILILLLFLFSTVAHAESKVAIRPLEDGRVQVWVRSDVPWTLEWSPDGLTWATLKRDTVAEWNGTQKFVGDKNSAGFYRVRPWYDSKNGSRI